MLTGTLSPVSNRADWIEAYGLYDEDGAPFDISDATEITVTIREAGTYSDLLTATLGDDEIEHIETGVIQWTFPLASMRRLCAKTYDVGITILKDEETIQLFVGTLPVVDGVVS